MKREEGLEYFSLHKKFTVYEKINCNDINKTKQRETANIRKQSVIFLFIDAIILKKEVERIQYSLTDYLLFLCIPTHFIFIQRVNIKQQIETHLYDWDVFILLSFLFQIIQNFTSKFYLSIISQCFIYFYIDHLKISCADYVLLAKEQTTPQVLMLSTNNFCALFFFSLKLWK